MSDAPSRRVGTTVRNKWTLERLLGTGGMAAVYVGIHRIGRRDALKILHPEAAQSKEICERFEREAQAANRFRHPGAVEIRDIDVTEDGAPFLVMELLDGESLADREQRLGRIVLPDVLRFAEQVLDTLDAAHAQGIIHRDIKPANLYVVGERRPRGRGNDQRVVGAGGDRIKVLDFGLARIRQDSSIQGQLTRMGLVLGTTPYMPPEQARGRDIDARADLFAVGATMYRLLSGRHVHEASSDFDLLMKMGKEPAPPLAARAPDVPRDVCLIVDRALAFDRDQRYADAALMLADLRAVARGAAPPYASRFAHGLDQDAATLQGAPSAAAAPPARAPAPRSAGIDADSIAVEWNDPPAPPTEPVSIEWSDLAVAPAEPVSIEWSDVVITPAEPVSIEWSDVVITPAEPVSTGRSDLAITGDDSISVDWSEEAAESKRRGAAGGPAGPSDPAAGSAPTPDEGPGPTRR